MNVEEIKLELKQFKMNPEDKQDWLNALRGDNYTQGFHRLKIPGGHDYPDCHCTLGVLGETKGRLTEQLSKYNLPLWLDEVSRSQTNLGEDILLKTPQNLITHLNDRLHLSFLEIADIIEECL